MTRFARTSLPALRLAALLWAPLAGLSGCSTDSPDAPGTWEFFPDELVFNTPVSTIDVRTFTVRNNGDNAITIDISRPVGDGNCPEEPFLPVTSEVTIAGNSSATLRIEHAPTLVPENGSCVYRLALTERAPDNATEDVLADRRSLRLDGGVRDVDADGDGWGRGEGDCNDRAIGDDPGDGLPGPASINPGMREACNGVDDDCDGLIDDYDVNEDVKLLTDNDPNNDPTAFDPLVLFQDAWHPDVDGDGFPREAILPLFRCEQPIGYVQQDIGLNMGWDCNDQAFEIYPGALDVAGEGLDRGCDGFVACFLDEDEDDWGGTIVSYATTLGNNFCQPLVDCATDPAKGPCVSPRGGDCNDSNDQISPVASEVCDGGLFIDEDCDSVANDSDPTVAQATQTIWYNDGDGDAEGNPLIFTRLCAQPGPQWVTVATDCNDGNDDINTTAQEICDSIDNNCDGLLDDNDPFVYRDPANPDLIWFIDRDNDLFGDRLNVVTRQACAQPLGYVNNQNDCDDRNATVNDFASEEAADDVDQNCDGLEECWCDEDGDSFGIRRVVLTRSLTCTDVLTDPGDPAPACTAVTDQLGDCDDFESENFPGNTEICDNIDNDCDGLKDAADGGVTADVLFLRDRDGDGYGNPGEPVYACGQPLGYAPSDFNGDGNTSPDEIDCDDQNPAARPGATEVIANGVDEDCDRRETCWDDSDNDGFGVTPPLGVLGATRVSGEGDLSCSGSQVSPNQNDCDDNSAIVRPDAVERCDGADADEDCDGAADDNDTSPLGTTAWYYDGDGDLIGANVDPFFRCDQPVGYASTTGDCNDASPSIHPGNGAVAIGVEVCNGFDDDCDGGTDDNDNPAVGTAINYANVAISRAATWWPDGDSDGYGANAGNLVLCDAPPQYVGRSGDCDDDNPEVRNGALEVVADGIDQNCDGNDDCRVDSDGDGFGSLDRGGASLLPGTICENAGFSSTSDDCNDNRADVSPVASEICDGADNDCDRRTDDRDDDVVPDFDTNAPDRYTWLRDGDADGYGNQGDVVYACNQPVGYVPESTAALAYAAVDCDDTSRLVNPTAAERTANGVDENCNNQEACYWDGDGDGYGVVASGPAPIRETTNGRLDCAQTGYSANTDDCNDSAAGAAINPSAVEVCDTVDNDCDGLSDDGDTSRVGGTFFYLDADGDLQGNPGQLVQRCTAPSGFVANLTDCNDTNPNIKDGGSEICDALNTDEDCDGLSEDADDNEDNTTKTRWYPDLDNDSEGDLLSGGELRCDALPTQVRTARDCNDADPGVRPGATDGIADNLDSDCDGFERCYCNKDGDDYGVTGSLVTVAIASPPPPSSVCSSPASPPASPAATCTTPGVAVSAVSGDCDDSDAGTGLAQTAYFLDADGDGFGNPNVIIVSCQAPPGAWVTNPLDCADNSATIRPGGQEICDPSNRDEDCDGFADDLDVSVSGGSLNTFRPDNDFDGFGETTAAVILKCDPAFNEVATTGDCDDDNAGVKPGAFDVVADDLDADCDGFERCYCNKDGDLFGISSELVQVVFNPASPFNACQPPASAPAVAAATCAAAGVSVAIQSGDCDDSNSTTGSSQTLWFYDADGDGQAAPTVFQLACTQPGAQWHTNAPDCDDTSAAINTAATEICDPSNNDEDCDGASEDADTNVLGLPSNKTTWYPDGDGDRYGAAVGVSRCDPLPTQVGAAGDCNDSNAAVNPAALEVTADNLDSNCDGVERCYCNRDGDSVGISSQLVDKAIATPPPAINVCTPPAVAPATPAATCTTVGAPVAILTGDCNDGDKNATSGASLRFLDDDADGRGNPDIYVFGCEVPAGNWVDNADDCNDSSSAVFGPGTGTAATETCDGLDNDCDGTPDDGLARTSYFYDGDGDTQGDPGTVLVGCVVPATGWVTDDSDCDDTRATVKVGGSEVCNNIDDDCDGVADDGLARVNYFYDGDGDTQGDPQTGFISCIAPPSGWVTDDQDCDDTSSAIKVGAIEACNGADEDCDGVADDGLTFLSYFYDGDGDTQGNPATATLACAAPGASWVTVDTDCDDTRATIKVGGAEVCNNGDDDCDGLVDDGLTFQFYALDADADAQGNPATAQFLCASPSVGTWVNDVRDCNDANAAIKTTAGNETVCNGVDDDCDGAVDDGLSLTSWSYDADGDTQGNPATTVSACVAPGANWVNDDRDCDDTLAIVKTQANESACNGLDDDCDGSIDDGQLTTFARDFDGDTYTPSGALTVTACTAPLGYAVPSGGALVDCNDTDPAINDGATETCDGVDNDCDGSTDEGGSTGTISCYIDADGDGYGTGAATLSCSCPAGRVSNGDDCQDVAFAAPTSTHSPAAPSAEDVNPDRAEQCNGYDDDCDGYVDFGADCGPTTSWIEYSNKAYLLVSSNTTWDDADLWCTARGYGLLRLETGDSGAEAIALDTEGVVVLGDEWWLAYGYQLDSPGSVWDAQVAGTVIPTITGNETSSLAGGSPSAGESAFRAAPGDWDPDNATNTRPFICEDQ